MGHVDGETQQQSTRQDTRTALVQAAERLIAEKGLGTVSVKDITRAAGARNPSAVHYHFGNVETLIREVFARRYQHIENERFRRLAKVNIEDPKRRLVALMEAALAPFLEGCLDEEGRLYVRFCVQLSSDPRFDLAELVRELGMESLTLLLEKIFDCLPDVSRPVLMVRLRQALAISLVQAADFARRLESGTDLGVEQTVREAAITLSAYLSAETA